ncbi:MAG TPA: hypothetical protein VKD90_16305 [Gemmataceae bacterium]|nr:hypothetical protein [Gemmataceae bacterium]
MRTLVVLFAVAAVAALGLFVPRGSSAPALGEKPVKYEYAELRVSRTIVAQPGVAGPGAAAGPRGAGAMPGGPGGAGGGFGMQPAATESSIRWATAQEEVVTKEWEEMADKLKAPAPKKQSPLTVHRLRVLNALSADGWEMLDRPLGDGSNTWSFRRVVR